VQRARDAYAHGNEYACASAAYSDSDAYGPDYGHSNANRDAAG
jgi:hypothetical protein